MMPRPPNEQTVCSPTTCWWSRPPGQYERAKAAKRANGVLSDNLLMIKERPIWCQGRQTSKRCALRQLVDDQGEANMMPRPPTSKRCALRQLVHDQGGQYDAKAAKRANGVLSDNLLMIKERPIWCQGRQTSIRCALRQFVDDQGEANMMPRPPNEQTVCSPTTCWWSRRGQYDAKAAKRAITVCSPTTLLMIKESQYDAKAAKRANGGLSDNLLMIKEANMMTNGRQTSKRCALRQLVDDQGEANMMTRPPNVQTVLSDNLLMIKERPIWCQGRQTSKQCALRQVIDDQGEANMMPRPPNEQTVCSPLNLLMIKERPIWCQGRQTSKRCSPTTCNLWLKSLKNQIFLKNITLAND